jgi:hypothetical protein
MPPVTFVLSQAIGCYAEPISSSQYGSGTRHPKGLSLTQLCSLFFQTNWNTPKVASNLSAAVSYDEVGDWSSQSFFFNGNNAQDIHTSVDEQFGNNIGIGNSSAYNDGATLSEEKYLICKSGLGLSVYKSAVHTSVEFSCPWSGGYKVGDLYYPEMTFLLECTLGTLGSGGPVARFDSTKTSSQISAAISDLNSRTNYYDSAGFDDLGRDYVSSDIPSPEYQTASVTFTLPGGITVPVSGYILPTYTMTYTQKLFEDNYDGWWGNKIVDYTSNCSVSSVTISTAGNWSYS